MTKQQDKPDDELRLMINEGEEEQQQEGEKETQSTAWRVGIFGLRSSFIALNIIGNGLIIASLGSDEQAAGSLVATTQTVICGTVFGFLQSVGLQLGRALGEKSADKGNKDTEISAIVKTGYAVGVALNLIGVATFLTVSQIYPLVMNRAIAGAANKFFIPYSYIIGPMFETLPGIAGLVISQIEKNMIKPLIMTALYRSFAFGFSYVFAKLLKQGMASMAYSSAASGFLTILLGLWFLTWKPYENYKFFTGGINDFYKQAKQFLSLGWRLALQRITEWGNLFFITLLIGIKSKVASKALLPAVQANVLIALCMQGMAQGAMIFIKEDQSEKKRHYDLFLKTQEEKHLESFKKISDAGKKTFFKNNLLGLSVAGVLFTVIYTLKSPLMSFFLASNLSADVVALADSMLKFNLISLMPDTLRIMSGGVLRGWGDLIVPTMMNALFMTVFGIGISALSVFAGGAGVVNFFFWRIVTSIISVVYNCLRFKGHLNNDQQLYEEGKHISTIYVSLLSNTNHHVGNDIFSALAASADFDSSKEQLINLVARELVQNASDYLRQPNSKSAMTAFVDSLRSHGDFNNKMIIKAAAKVLEKSILFLNASGNGYYSDQSSSQTLVLVESNDGYSLQDQSSDQHTNLYQHESLISQKYEAESNSSAFFACAPSRCLSSLVSLVQPALRR